MSVSSAMSRAVFGAVAVTLTSFGCERGGADRPSRQAHTATVDARAMENGSRPAVAFYLAVERGDERELPQSLCSTASADVTAVHSSDSGVGYIVSLSATFYLRQHRTSLRCSFSMDSAADNTPDIVRCLLVAEEPLVGSVYSAEMLPALEVGAWVSEFTNERLRIGFSRVWLCQQAGACLAITDAVFRAFEPGARWRDVPVAFQARESLL